MIPTSPHLVTPLQMAIAAQVEKLRYSKATYHNVDVEKFWYDGDLSFKFWPVQHRMAAVLESPGSLKKVLNCSRRTRKTTTALIKSIERALKKEYALIRYAAPTGKMLRTIIHPIMRKICEDAPPDLKPIWKPQDGLYLFPSTRAELHIAGVNNGHEDDMRGNAADLCVLDEAQLIDKLKYIVNDVMIPQLLAQDHARGELWMIITPPKTPVHECMQFVQEAKLAKCYAEFTIDDSEYTEDVKEIFATEAGGRESVTWKREYFCQFIVDTNYSIVPEFKDEYIREYVPDEFHNFYEKYEGMDIGVRDKTVNLFATYDFKKATLFVQDEISLEGAAMTTQLIADQIKAKEKALWPGQTPRLRISDNNNLILLQDLGLLHGIHFAPTLKDTLEAMVNEMRLWVGRGRLIVSPRCEQLIGCLKYGVWNDRRTEWERSSVYGHFDALAALMYLLRNIDQATNPIPRFHNVDPENTFIDRRERDRLTDQGEELKKAFRLK